MLVEKLENRQLFTAITPSLSSLQILDIFALNPQFIVHMTSRSEGKAETELGTFFFTVFPIGSPARVAAAPAAAAAGADNLTIELPAPNDPFELAFNPSTLEPFGSTYTVKLSKPSLSVFNITQKIGKEKLHFTGKLNAKLTTLSGVLTVTGPTNQVSFTYSGKLAK
jgi:hypothetical protein